MIILGIVSVVLICFAIYHHFEFYSGVKGIEKEIAVEVLFTIAGLAFVWFLGGLMVPCGTIKKDITKEVQIAKGENFVVFDYGEYMLKTTDYEVVKNPEKSKVYFEVDTNIYGQPIHVDRVEEYNPMGLR